MTADIIDATELFEARRRGVRGGRCLAQPYDASWGVPGLDVLGVTMAETIVVNSITSFAHAIARLEAEWQEHRYLEIEIKRKASQRTLTQNRALHLFLTQLAEALNDAGFDMRATLKHDAEIPWTAESAKEHLWRPIQKALTQKHSTTEITTVEPTVIHETLCRHLGQKLGVACPPWPCRDNRRVA